MNIIIDSEGCEFGSEIVLVVSRVYQEFLKGHNVKVITSIGMEPFYFFLPKSNIITKHITRKPGSPSWDKLHKKNLPNEFCFPDFVKEYSSYRLNLHITKPLLLVSNKYNEEWGREPINFLSKNILEKIFSIFYKKFHIIYNIPSKNKITNDNSKIYNLDLGNLLQKYNVIDINSLPHKNFNKLQLIIGCKSKYKISVQGGNSILSSLTAGHNFIYAVKGQELKCGAFKWYSKLSNCQVKASSDYKDLLQNITSI